MGLPSPTRCGVSGAGTRRNTQAYARTLGPAHGKRTHAPSRCRVHECDMACTPTWHHGPDGFGTQSQPRSSQAAWVTWSPSPRASWGMQSMGCSSRSRGGAWYTMYLQQWRGRGRWRWRGRGRGRGRGRRTASGGRDWTGSALPMQSQTNAAERGGLRATLCACVCSSGGGRGRIHNSAVPRPKATHIPAVGCYTVSKAVDGRDVYGVAGQLLDVQHDVGDVILQQRAPNTARACGKGWGWWGGGSTHTRAVSRQDTPCRCTHRAVASPRSRAMTSWLRSW
jgi:hypothetical protein